MPARETVELDTRGAEVALKGLSNAWRDHTKAATDAGKAQKGVEDKTTDLGKTLDAVGQELGKFNRLLGVGGLVAAAVAAVTKMDELVRKGIEMQSVFGNLAIPIDKAREATRGLVDDMTLATAANNAVRLGVVESEKDFAKLAEAATKLGLSTGQGAAKSVEDLTTALARGSTQILDNLGITLKQEEAQRLYAEKLGKSVDALTDVEKAEAFRVIGLEKALEASQEVNLAVDEGLVKWEQTKAQLQVLGKEVMPLVADAAGAMAGQIETSVGFLTELAETTNTIRGELRELSNTLEENSTLWQRLNEAWEESPIRLNPVQQFLEIQRRELERGNKELKAWLETEDEVNRSSPAFVNAVDKRIDAVRDFINELQVAQDTARALNAMQTGSFASKGLAEAGGGALSGALGGALQGAASEAASTATARRAAEEKRRRGRKGAKGGDPGFDEHFSGQVRNAREVSALTADPNLEAEAHAEAIDRMIEKDRERTEFASELTQERLDLMDMEIERQAALGQETDFLYERRMELAIEAAEEEGRIDEAAELRHKREIARIERNKKALQEEQKIAEKNAQAQIKFRRDIESVVAQTSTSIAQITEAAAKASGRSAEEVAQATTVARGIETLARAALEQVEAIAAFARYDFLSGAAHQIAAATGFALGGMMLAGQVPSGGQTAAGGGAGGGGGPPGGSRFGSAERTIEERPEFPTSPQEAQAKEQTAGAANDNRGQTIVVQGTINEQVLFEAVHNANEDGPRRTGTF